MLAKTASRKFKAEQDMKCDLNMELQDCSASEVLEAITCENHVQDHDCFKSRREIFEYSKTVDTSRFSSFGTLVHDYVENCHGHPQGLYHYTTLGVLQTFLHDTGGIYGTRCDQLNDRNEIVLGAKIFCKVLKEEFGCRNDIESFVRERLNHLFSQGIMPYVFCLSSEGDYLPQWRAYTDRNVGGYAVGFSPGMLFDAIKKIDAMHIKNCCYQIWPCFYLDYDDVEYIIKNYINFNINAFRCLLDENRDNVAIDKAVLMIATLLPFIKHWHFKEEHEWRIVRTCYSVCPEDARYIGGKIRVPIPIELISGRVHSYLTEVVLSPHGDIEFLKKYARLLMQEFKLYFLAIRDSRIGFR